ncbi:hypothetical protein D6D01_09222 [Aureobasidium pullulans]|uniref:Uncharacterized protein n=1 Tax=Aureobasidium pullulans TaxID=5580 RepID=A0A4S9K6K2_AURPU|nr:hypothetical protein D6D01_09222 [Aureobasidium pullulans]
MRSSIALFSLVAGVHALESASSQCTESSIHHTTTISTRTFTATFTAIPSHSNAASAQEDGTSLMISATQAFTFSDSGITTKPSSEITATIFATDSPSFSTASDVVSSQISASASGPQPSTPGASGATGQSSIGNSPPSSSFNSSSILVSVPTSSQWSTQSRYSPPPTMATSTATTAGNSSSPKHSVIAFTGSSSTTTTTGGAALVAFLFAMLLL